MAKLASDQELQLWFLQLAGVDPDLLGKVLGTKIREQLIFEPNALLQLPLITSANDLKPASVDLRPRLPWLVNALPHPEHTVALRPSVESSIPDSELSFVVVDAFPRDAWTLLGKLVAVYFRPLDVREAVEWMTDPELEEFLHGKKPIEKTVAGATMLEGFFVGLLNFKVKESRQKRSIQLAWHVGLEMHDERCVPFIEPISHLCYEDPATCKMEEQLRPGCELIGEVIGWSRM